MKDCKKDIKNLFSVPIAEIDCNEYISNLKDLNNDLIKAFIGDLIDRGYQNASARLNVYQSIRNLEKHEPFQILFQKIKPLFDSFFSNIHFCEDFINRYKLTNVWGNLTTGVGFHAPHIHGLGNHTPFSAVYFPCIFADPEKLDDIKVDNDASNCTDEKIGTLTFLCPAFNLKQVLFGYPSEVCYNEYSVLPSAGKLVIFPSFLTHFVTPSVLANKNNTRISFSFYAADNL